MTRTTDLSHAEFRRGVTAALRRAAKAALRLAQETGTPCWVMVDGKIVDLNARPAPRRKRLRRSSSTVRSPSSTARAPRR